MNPPSTLDQTNTLLATAGLDYPAPIVLFLTGSSGCGKTYLAQAIEKRLDPVRSAVCFFDRIGVPSVEQMISDFGSTEKWQEAMTQQWVNSISSMKGKALVILEGQYHPRFALEAASSEGLREFVLAVVTADQEVWEARLRGPRGQPDLVSDDMRNWARFLREETLRLGGAVIDTSASDIAINLNQVADLINPLLQRRNGRALKS